MNLRKLTVNLRNFTVISRDSTKKFFEHYKFKITSNKTILISVYTDSQINIKQNIFNKG